MSRKLLVMAGLLSSLFLGACSVIGYRGGTEEPQYAVTDHLGAVEIRHYGERVAAETTLPGPSAEATRNDAFRILAAYIFGKNKGKHEIAMTAPVAQSSQQIAMTAPVSQSRTDTGWQMRFFLPAGLTVATAPQPVDPRVHIVPVPPADYAVLRFTGSRDDAAVKAHMQVLERALAGSGWQRVGQPVAWFYDPPWTIPFLRRNEVAVEVRRAP